MCNQAIRRDRMELLFVSKGPGGPCAGSLSPAECARTTRHEARQAWTERTFLWTKREYGAANARVEPRPKDLWQMQKVAYLALPM